MNIRTANTPADIDAPVLIVGGGGAGLTCSMLLAQLGVESLLVNSLPTTSILPKAHVLNQRTMEILSDVGVAEAIYAKSTLAENMAAMGWYGGSSRRGDCSATPLTEPDMRARIRLFGSICQNSSDSWADTRDRLRSFHKALSEAIRPSNQDGG